MRLLYLSQSRFISKSASSIHVAHMCEAWANAGADITVLGFSEEGGDLYSYYGVNDRTRYQRFNIKEIPGETVWLSIRAALWVIQEKLIDSVDILYGRSQIVLLAFLIFKKPFLLEIHSAPRTFVHKIIERILIKSKRNLGVVFITGALESLYRKEYGRWLDNKTLVASDAAKLPASGYDRIQIKGNNLINIGYVGHLYKGKGGDFLLELAATMPDIGFHLVGGREEDIQRLSSRVTPDNVYFYGHIQPSKTPVYLRSFDILLAPYSSKVGLARTNADIGRWMSPLKIFEYMAAQKPIIASDLPVLQEVLVDKKNCLLAAPEDISSWSRAIRVLIDRPDLRSYISKTAYEEYLTKYTWDVRVEKIKKKFGFN